MTGDAAWFVGGRLSVGEPPLFLEMNVVLLGQGVHAAGIW